MNREILEQDFEASQVKQRKGAGGRTFDYIDTTAVIRRLNAAFDSEWSLQNLC